MNLNSSYSVLVMLVSASSLFAMSGDGGVHSDLAGDAEFRRTDSGNDAPLPMGHEP